MGLRSLALPQFSHGAVVGGPGELEVGVDDAAPGSVTRRPHRHLVSSAELEGSGPSVRREKLTEGCAGGAGEQEIESLCCLFLAIDGFCYLFLSIT